MYYTTAKCDLVSGGRCELLSSVDPAYVKPYGCNPPMYCQSNADCPGTGECYIDTCYYYANYWAYPECRVNADCASGICTSDSFQCAQ
jgi:hypothetical protein